MISRSSDTKQVELNIVGSSSFGRYPKISQEKTFNMFISDGWMVPYAGYLNVNTGIPNEDMNGRAIYTSNILNAMIGIWDTNVYLITTVFNNAINTYTITKELIGELDPHTTDIFIAENPIGQIAITDGFNIYIYDPNHIPSFYIATGVVVAIETDPPTTPTFKYPALNFSPGFITYQNGRFIVASLGTNTWRISGNYATNLANFGKKEVLFPYGVVDDTPPVGYQGFDGYKGELITKPDNVVAVLRVPSRGNMLYVFGSNVVEVWFDQGLQGFPYERSQSFNIDYGCVNPSTIAWNDEYVVWLAQNEKSGPIIVSSEGGGEIEKITTDGIDYLLSSINNPQDSEAFMYRQDGHLFYHINFYTDNFSLFYDFNTKKFYNACDQNGNYFIAKEVSFYNNQYYFVTPENGNLYSFDTNYTTFDGEEIPRYRICKNVRLPSQENFIITDLGFTIEQGTTDYTYMNGMPYPPRLDISFSYDGGQSFGNFVSQYLNGLGSYRNMLRFWQLGMTNDFVVQIRYRGVGRFLSTNGIVNIRQ